jgi:predicted permease
MAILAAVIGLHALCARWLPDVNRVTQFAACWLVGVGALYLGLRGEQGLFSFSGAAVLASYAFGGELYVFLFTFVGSSVAASLLLNQVAPTPQSANEMVRKRLERLAAAGLIQDTSEGLRLTRKGRFVACTFRTLRRLFQHETPPEFAQG